MLGCKGLISAFTPYRGNNSNHPRSTSKCVKHVVIWIPLYVKSYTGPCNTIREKNNNTQRSKTKPRYWQCKATRSNVVNWKTYYFISCLYQISICLVFPVFFFVLLFFCILTPKSIAMMVTNSLRKESVYHLIFEKKMKAKVKGMLINWNNVLTLFQLKKDLQGFETEQNDKTCSMNRPIASQVVWKTLNIPSFHFTKRQKHACNQKFSSISLN